MKSIITFIATVLLFLLSVPYSFSQQSGEPPKAFDKIMNDTLTVTEKPTEAQIHADEIVNKVQSDDAVYLALDNYFQKKVMKSPEFMVCVMLLVFAVCIMGFQVIIFNKQTFTPNQVIRLFVLSLVIFGTLFLIATGYRSDQIAPAIGLLGTIAGYLLGKQQVVAPVPAEKLITDKEKGKNQAPQDPEEGG